MVPARADGARNLVLRMKADQSAGRTFLLAACVSASGSSVISSQFVLLSFLAYELVDGFDRPSALVAVAEMGPLGVVVDEPLVEVGL